MMYFRHGTISDTVPYSLVVTDNIDHNWTSLVTLEDPSATYEKYTEGFQLTYINPINDTLGRIYCMDTLTTTGNNGTVDTGVNTSNQAANHHFTWDADNAYLYQMENSIKYLLACKELKNSKTGTNDIRVLAVPESQLSATVVPVALEAHTQHSCDSWVVDSPATTSTPGLKTGTCTVCNREVQEVIPVLTPAFCGRSVSMQDDFSINCYVDKAVFTDGVYSNPYVVFELEGKQTIVSAYTQKDDCYIFTFDGITPR